MQISDSFIVGRAIVQIIEGQCRGTLGRKLWYVDLRKQFQICRWTSNSKTSALHYIWENTFMQYVWNRKYLSGLSCYIIKMSILYSMFRYKSLSNASFHSFSCRQVTRCVSRNSCPAGHYFKEDIVGSTIFIRTLQVHCQQDCLIRCCYFKWRWKCYFNSASSSVSKNYHFMICYRAYHI